MTVPAANFAMYINIANVRKFLHMLVTCLREPRFLVVWNIHASCNLLCATRGIVTCNTHTLATRVWQCVLWPLGRGRMFVVDWTTTLT